MPFIRPFAAVLAGSFFAAAAPGQTSSSDQVDEATFRAICGSCHSVALVDGLRTEEEWRDEIKQMIKVGARGTEEQFARVMRVLVRTLTIVNVNTADARQIAPVLDVSDAVADAVVKQRESAGNFKSLDDLGKVPGLSREKLRARKDRIVF